MKDTQAEISSALADELDALGEERGGRVACIVIIRSDELEVVWPGAMTPASIRLVETVILEALSEDAGDWP